MNKFITIILVIFEFLFYTLLMVLIESIPLTSETLKLLIHFGSIILISVILYFLIRFILHKLKMNSKKYLYLIPLSNVLIGTILPGLLVAIIPNEKIFWLFFAVIVSTIYYGVLINIMIVILNFLFTKDKN